MKLIYVILLVALVLFGCKKEEECGCESEPYKTVSNVETKLYYGIYFNSSSTVAKCI